MIMIRMIVGLILIMGAVGQEDFAMEVGTQGPPLIQTLAIVLLGVGIIASAVPKLVRQGTK